jgi:LPS sulfotransferase NodH
MVSKNVVCSVRVEAIAAFVPEMQFLVMHRDHLEVATSILVARKTAQGSYTDWWSVEPANVDQLRHLPPERQVVEQVRAVEQAIDRARLTLQPERFIDIYYADLLADPRAVLAQLARRLGLQARAGAPALPATFSRRDRSKLDPELATRLAEYLGR